MPVSVYVDVLLVVNFIINYLLLRVTTFITGRSFVWWRIYLASILGSLSSLIIFLPLAGNIQMTAYKLFIAMLMIISAFGFRGYIKWLIDVAVLFAVSFVFSGAMLALYFLTPQDKLLFYNGVVYFDISAVFLLSAIVIGYGASMLILRLVTSKHPTEQLCIVNIVANGGMVSLKGLIDTGNSLTEPFSGLPVIVVCKSLIENILPEGLKSSVPSISPKGNVRFIPFQTVGGGGILAGFKPDFIKINIKNKEIIAKEVYIGVSSEDVSSGEYDAIVNPTILSEKG